MTPRDRFHACLEFGEPDRVFYFSMRAPVPTVERWETEGLPKGADLREYFGLDAMLTPFWRIGVGFGPLPNSGRTVVEETEEYRVERDVLGATVRMHKDRRDFGGQQYLDFPVKDRPSFHKVRPYFDAAAPARYADDWEDRVARWRGRDYPLYLTIPGPFSFLRGLMGMEGLCLATCEQPALVEEMVEYLTGFVTGVIGRALDDVEVDIVLLGGEDMAYKNASILSPDTVRRFMLDSYRRIAEYASSGGARQVMLDSDGNVDELMPVWLDAGITSFLPFEVAAGMDPLKLRRHYPRLAMLGGIDKRALTQGRKAIETEVMSKVPALLDTGGYIPAVDHILSPDIPLDGFRHYTELIRKIAEG